jgi:hypothetical protein
MRRSINHLKLILSRFPQRNLRTYRHHHHQFLLLLPNLKHYLQVSLALMDQVTLFQRALKQLPVSNHQHHELR